MSLNLIPHAVDPLSELLTRAAFAPLTNTGWISVTGEDRVRWLNGMVTNSIQDLKPGDGCYNFFLSAQGRIQGDCTAWMQGDSILLETGADQVPALMALLERFIIMDDVELDELGHARGLLVAGPRSGELLRLIYPNLPASDAQFFHPDHENDLDEFLHVIQAHSPLVPRYELWPDENSYKDIVAALGRINVPEATSEAVEHLRLLEGTPLYGIDIRDKELAQETNQTRALHFSKGCYLGQEIVERIRSRGNVHRTFQAFTLTGDVPAPGSPLTANAKPVGEITSAADVPGHGILALGYIRREALDSKAPLTYAGGTAEPRAVGSQPSALS